MTTTEIISLVVTFIGVAGFASVFTILFRSYVKAQIGEIKAGKKDIEIIDKMVYEKKITTQKRRKAGKIISHIIFYVLLIIIIPLFVFSLINKFSGNVMMLGNKTIMVVASGSMSEKNIENAYLSQYSLDNQFSQYDIIVLEKVNNESDISLYDVVAYRNDKGINVIHRIIKVNAQNYETRGDANNASDAYNPKFADIIGKYTGKRLKGIGMFVMFLQSYSGIITLVSLVYCVFMIDSLTSKINRVQSDRTKMLEDAMDCSKDLGENELSDSYIENVFYKGFEYTFTENGFVEKNEITDAKYLVKSGATLIKEITKDQKIISSEVVIKSEEQND